eukprot:13371196-Ditylum_brightwellii.AAC.1
MSIFVHTCVHVILGTSDDNNETSRASVYDEKVEDSKLYSPTVTEIRPDMRTKDIKGDMKHWVQVDIVSVECKPIIDLESEEFKEDDTEIQFRLRKEHHGHVVYEELPTMEQPTVSSPFTPSSILHFLAITYYMDIVCLPNKRDDWRNDTI